MHLLFCLELTKLQMFWLVWRGRQSSASGFRTSEIFFVPSRPRTSDFTYFSLIGYLFCSTPESELLTSFSQQYADSTFFFLTIFAITFYFINQKHQRHFSFLHVLLYLLKQKDQKCFLKANLFLFFQNKSILHFLCIVSIWL